MMHKCKFKYFFPFSTTRNERYEKTISAVGFHPKQSRFEGKSVGVTWEILDSSINQSSGNTYHERKTERLNMRDEFRSSELTLKMLSQNRFGFLFKNGSKTFSKSKILIRHFQTNDTFNWDFKLILDES